MSVHTLKINCDPFEDLLCGAKTGEVRFCGDRVFNVGDDVILQEVTEANATDLAYTGREMRRTITHIQRGYGLPDHLCVLSYAPLRTEQAATVPVIVHCPTCRIEACDREYCDVCSGVMAVGELFAPPAPVMDADRRDAEFDIEAAAKEIADCFDYPWSYMPEEGKENIRKNARRVIDAALTKGEVAE